MDGAAGQRDSKYVTSHAGLGMLMYQQLSNGRNIFLSAYELGEAFGRLIRGRANIVREGICFFAVGLVYGGAHLATWNNHFETLFEQHAWRACSITITTGAFFGLPRTMDRGLCRIHRCR